MTKPESLVVKVLVRTYILTIQTQVFLFKSNYGTAVVIGAILALFIGYHINIMIMHFILLSILPICLAYLLRKVYIYTLTHS